MTFESLKRGNQIKSDIENSTLAILACKVDHDYSGRVLQVNRNDNISLPNALAIHLNREAKKFFKAEKEKLEKELEKL